MNNINQLIGQLDPASLLAGLASGLIFAAILGMAMYNRLQRQQLILSMRMEQAGKNGRRLEEDAHRLRIERNNLREQCVEIGNNYSALQTAFTETKKQAEEREQLFTRTRRQMEQNFQIMADQILTEKGRLLTDQHEAGLHGLLQPMREQLADFKKKVEDVYDRESRDRISMVNEIEHLKKLNERISRDAVNLTDALQGKNKLQGQWGEMILEQLLEDSGLRPGTEFETQVSIKNEQGHLRQPDVIVHLPRKRDIIIDAKVSLKAYTKAHQEEDPDKRKKHIGTHIESLKKHISGLSGKKYPQLLALGSIDFVL
ncbi:MAG: DNA recombination protein RmuC, partial [Desulfobulbaceae bacterium]|nr:DNA recombination protein RmuC [Desulfobulbaceae bacterium]